MRACCVALLIALLLSCLIASVRSDAQEQTGQRWALLIGVNDYRQANDLKHCVADQQVFDRLQQCPAVSKLLVVDACIKDPQLAGKRTLVEVKEAFRQFATPLGKPPLGVAIFNSCAAGEISWADKETGRGVFMNYLVEGLKGRADENRSGRVSVKELTSYASKKTKVQVADQFSESQRPYLKGSESSEALEFEVGKVVNSAPARIVAAKPVVAGPWTGKRYMPRVGVEFRNGDEQVDAATIPAPFEVLAEAGEWVWAGTAWVKKSQIVAVDSALEYYTACLAENPKNSWAHYMSGVLQHDRQEIDLANKAYGEAIRWDSNYADAYHARAHIWLDKQEDGRALADCDAAIRLKTGSVCVYNTAAWIRATHPDARLRDGKKAVAIATEACERSQWKDPECMDTLAAAYAEAGDFERAIEWQKKALSLSDDDAQKEDYKAHLQLYQSRKPYRDARDAPA